MSAAANGTPARTATAKAHANIALVKYWGKRDIARNLPLVGSLSITLDGLTTTTSVRFDPALRADRCTIDGQQDAAQRRRVSDFLDLLRQQAGCNWQAQVDSHNDFPTGAGLASSASGFAALVTAGAGALGLELSPAQLSALARQGSGSAARSMFGGFVEWHRGEAADGHDSVAEGLLPASEWPLRVLVAITDAREKPVGSRQGMQRSDATAPFMAAWEQQQPADLARARNAITERDFAALAAVAEHSCLKMHALALSAQPGLIYWNGATVEGMHCVRRLRDEGAEVFFTVDAGPQLKAVCTPEHAAAVHEALARLPGVERIIACDLGDGARLVPTPSAASAISNNEETAS